MLGFSLPAIGGLIVAGKGRGWEDALFPYICCPPAVGLITIAVVFSRLLILFIDYGNVNSTVGSCHFPGICFWLMV